ncbi:peptidyl-prolyl isomerase CWC27 [Ophiocordyceps camponoti-floridani]|uniref:peptidylprolyl isomerase n=1 Tax=Ophiocordyceps camponoti-floridani TaxID=2030778 RepID=A0A8H4VCQ1_9HYPO|nr:peptidyl-prolyl isomerase CWC27 [Ophiocordyceps camponoti-floridani]
MSALYNLEPQPTASAIIHTTLGEVQVELFAKQTPLACRNFLQLSLDGYYDGTIFHRLVPGFILQGGDPTGSGNGGESIYDGGEFSGDLDPWPMDQRRGQNAGLAGVNFKDEFHSRLKFNRRGLLGMANESRPDTNGSQFFFTLDKTEELTGKNTLFGRVAGDTIYNLAKIGESEVEEGSERPLYPVRIERVEILINPFEDMKKRSRVATQTPSRPPPTKDKKKKRKGGKQLLSFGDNDDDDVEEENPVFKKTKFDTRLVAAEEADENPQREKPSSNRRSGVKNAKVPNASADKTDKDQETVEFAQPKKEVQAGSPPSPSPPRSPTPPRKSALQKAQEEMAALKASMRRTAHSEQPEKVKKVTTLESMIPQTSIRGRKRRPGGNFPAGSDDGSTVRMLKAFQSRLDLAPPEKETKPSRSAEHGDEGSFSTAPDGEIETELCDLHFIANCQSCTAWDKQKKEQSDDEGWMSHALSFAADRLGKDLTTRKKAEEELVLIDPREKARTLKDEKRAEREARTGGSGRAWDQARDQARNAKLARTASLAGRGAQ